MIPMNHVGILALLCLLLPPVIAGCAKSGEKGPGDPIVCRIDAPDRIRTGTAATITLKVLNTTDSTMEIGLSGRPADYITLEDDRGRVVWQSHAGDAILEILEMRLLAGGEEWNFTAPWQGRDAGGRPFLPGRYILRAGVRVDGPENLEADAKPLTILP